MCGEKSKTAASTIGDLYYRTSIYEITILKIYKRLTMKIAHNDFHVTPEIQNKILRVTFESTIEIRGITFPNTFLEPIDNKFIPDDECVYDVPAVLH